MPTRKAESAGANCPTCGRLVPPGEFCGACGARLSGETGGRHRMESFAADPGEHVFHLSLVSTLFPHLPHRRGAPFRLGLVITATVLLVLGAARLTGPSLAAAATAVLILYLMYLYEVEVYEDEPVLVIGVTVVLGLVLGAAWAFFTGPIVTGGVLANLSQSAGVGDLAVAALLPVGAQALMLVGGVILYVSRKFDESLDGFTFGAAGALGFTCAATLVNLLPELRQGLFSSGPPLDNAVQIFQRGLLVPVINASTTGLIAGALWLRRGRSSSEGNPALAISLPATILVAVVVQGGLGVANFYLARNSALDVGLYLVTAALLLFWVRLALHHLLLAEAVNVEIGPDGPCTHCHRVVPRMAFCPNCGIATRATPKAGQGRLGRVTR